MANSKSAAKRARASERRREVNRQAGSKARTMVRLVRQALGQGNKDEAAAALAGAHSALDRAAKVRACHPNKAARLKSRLAKKLKA
jgi:small subunit ribosomal protein S20